MQHLRHQLNSIPPPVIKEDRIGIPTAPVAKPRRVNS